MNNTLTPKWKKHLLLAVFLLLCAAPWTFAESPPPDADNTNGPQISFPESIDENIYIDTSRVTEALRDQTKTLFGKEPLGWDWQTIEYLPSWFFSKIS